MATVIKAVAAFSVRGMAPPGPQHDNVRAPHRLPGSAIKGPVPSTSVVSRVRRFASTSPRLRRLSRRARSRASGCATSAFSCIHRRTSRSRRRASPPPPPPFSAIRMGRRRNLRIDYRWSVEKAPARTLFLKATLHGFLRPQAISAIIFHFDTQAPRSLNRPGTKDGQARLSGEGLPPTQRPGREPPYLRRNFNASKECGSMVQIKIRWGDLGSPVEPGTYRCRPHIVEVVPGDINLPRAIGSDEGDCGPCAWPRSLNLGLGIRARPPRRSASQSQKRFYFALIR